MVILSSILASKVALGPKLFQPPPLFFWSWKVAAAFAVNSFSIKILKFKVTWGDWVDGVVLGE